MQRIRHVVWFARESADGGVLALQEERCERLRVN